MVTRPDPAMARRLQMLLGGASGEFTASTTYLNQRYCMPVSCVRALLTDIGTEELSHVEMLSVMITGLLQGASTEGKLWMLSVPYGLRGEPVDCGICGNDRRSNC